MLKKIFTYNSLAICSALTTIGYAQPQSHYVVAPDCLAKQLTAEHHVISRHHNFSLINVQEKALLELMKLKAKKSKRCGGFVNVTEDFQLLSKQKKLLPANYQTFLKNYLPQETVDLIPLEKAASYSIRYEKQVSEALKNLVPQNMWTNLTKFSSFPERYAGSENGVEAAQWLEGQVKLIAKQYNRNDLSIVTVPTPFYEQHSVVVKLGESTEPGIVVSAHLDGVPKSFDEPDRNMPAADDDGSGSVTVLETLRTLLATGYNFNKPIYFIWYAAEEEGLLGSQAVVKHFKKKNIPVSAVFHMDLTGYAHNNEDTMWLISDNVHTKLSKYLETLINTYVHKPVKYTACGYECSDHASWTNAGIPAAIPAESAYEDTNPYIHSPEDTMDNLSLTHMTDYVKLAIAFAVELGEPKA